MWVWNTKPRPACVSDSHRFEIASKCVRKLFKMSRRNYVTQTSIGILTRAVHSGSRLWALVRGRCDVIGIYFVRITEIDTTSVTSRQFIERSIGEARLRMNSRHTEGGLDKTTKEPKQSKTKDPRDGINHQRWSSWCSSRSNVVNLEYLVVIRWC